MDCDNSGNCGNSTVVADEHSIVDESSVIERVTVEGRFTSVGGFAYKATLSWLHSTCSRQEYVHDPVFKHSCHGCVHFSGMVEFPCFCVLELALNLYKHDKRWPKEHPMKHDVLPASFYPHCFHAEENHHLLLKENLGIKLPTDVIIDGFNGIDFTNRPLVKPPPQYKGTVESGLRIPLNGEGGLSKARVARKKKKKDIKKKNIKKKDIKKKESPSKAGQSNTDYAHEFTRIVKSNAPNAKLASSLLGNDEQFVPSSEQSEHIESTTNSKLTKDYKCAHCNATGHVIFT
jgi:hypothetical protein